jgi:uncharacterized membrane protein
VRATTVVGVPTATGIVAGAAVAGAVVLVGVLAWALVRWPRWEDRVFRPRTEVELRQPEWAPPRPMPGRGEALGPDGHRAFAQALHAVTAAYLAECEREARR